MARVKKAEEVHLLAPVIDGTDAEGRERNPPHTEELSREFY